MPPEEDLFGSTMPENLPPAERRPRSTAPVKSLGQNLQELAEKGDPELSVGGGSGKAKKAKPSDFNRPTYDLWRKRGYSVSRCDQYNAYSGRWHDLFGFLDMIAVREGDACAVGIQLTSRAEVLPHIRDIAKDDKARAHLRNWLGCGQRLVVIGWSKENGRWSSVEREVYWRDVETVLAGGRLSLEPPRPQPQRSLYGSRKQ